MRVLIAAAVVALLTGFGAVQELLVRGLGGGEGQPLAVGLVGTLVGVLYLCAGVAYWRRARYARRLCVVAGSLGLLFHVAAALPPHRNVGLLALLVGGGFGLFLLALAAGPALTAGVAGGGRPAA